MLRKADEWKDYSCIDAGSGEKLEQWKGIVLRRPDPQAIWPAEQNKGMWKKADAVYHRSSKGGGSWEYRQKLPESWTVNYKELTFKVSPTGFKHTGLFPEQAVNWDWFSKIIRDAVASGRYADRPVKVLNLFAYTGGATISALAAGAHVAHVDASKGMTGWAKENAADSGLADKPVRWLVDDCVKFVEREIRRGNKYDGIIMDPPSYGRGPKGETWKIEESIYPFIKLTMDILSDDPLFFLINSYTTGLQPAVLSYMLGSTIGRKYGGRIESSEIGLPVTDSGLILPCGASGRWMKD